MSSQHPFLGRSGPTNPMSHERIIAVCEAYNVLFDRYIAIGGKFDEGLYHTKLTIEKELIHWQQRSSKLKYAARRQAAYRAARRPDDPLHGDTVTFDDASATADLSILPTSTMATLRAYKEQHGATEAEAPDTSGYKNSGLV